MSYDQENVFAKILKGQIPSVKVYEDDKTFVMMDIMPQSKGHLLILPKEGASNLFEISLDALQACMATAKKIAPALMKATQADGLVMTQFNGSSAGQTVFHLHVHLIPRYEGQPLQHHSQTMADQEELKALAQKIKENMS